MKTLVLSVLTLGIFLMRRVGVLFWGNKLDVFFSRQHIASSPLHISIERRNVDFWFRDVIQHRRPWFRSLLRKWFVGGIYCMAVLQLFAFCFLGWRSLRILLALLSSASSAPSTAGSLQTRQADTTPPATSMVLPVIPGWTFPDELAEEFWLGTFLALALHEFGSQLFSVPFP